MDLQKKKCTPKRVHDFDKKSLIKGHCTRKCLAPVGKPPISTNWAELLKAFKAC